MKKTLVSALTTALVVGAASTTFAAANPFSDVPADHWAYDAVTQLAQDGVIEGYGDGTFRGDRNITRYEMAQMVAKAMAKSDVSAKTKALIDKLAAEFSDELNNLGIRVAELEKHADKVKWNGTLEATYTYTKHNADVRNANRKKNSELVFRLEPTAEINDHWDVHARIDASVNPWQDDGDAQAMLKRAWAEGNYGNFNVKIGKLPNEINIFSITDDPFSGISMAYGKDWKGRVAYGRMSLDGTNINNGGGIGFDSMLRGANGLDGAFFGGRAADYIGLGVQYESEANPLSGGIAWQRVNFKNGLWANMPGIGFTSLDDNLDIFSVNVGYKFNKNVGVKANYAHASSLTFGDNGVAGGVSDTLNQSKNKQAYNFEIDYKGAQPENRGSWGAYIAYRHLGQLAAPVSTYSDGVNRGQKGFELGVGYVPAKNILAQLKYFQGKDIVADQVGNDGKARKFFARVNWFF